MKTPPSDSLKCNLALLRQVANELGARTRPLNLHDSQVARSTLHWREALRKETILPPDRFVRQVRCAVEGYPTVVRVNDEVVVIEMRGPFGGNILCSFNQQNVICGASKLASQELIAPHDWKVFLSDHEVSRDAVWLLKQPAFSRHIEALDLDATESLHILRGQVKVYLRRYESRQILDVLDILVAFVKSLPTVPQEPIDLKQLPKEFHSLIPLIKRWGVADDEQRSELLSRVSRKTRSRLVELMNPYFDAINDYLDSFGKMPLPEHAILLGALAECASEAMKNAER